MTDTNTTSAVPTPSLASPATEACKRDRMKENLAYGALALLALVILLVFLKGLPTDNAALVLIGGIVSGVMLNNKEVYGFVFGSSQGSQDKTDAMAAAATPVPPTTPAQ